MYATYFGLSENPFSMTPDHRYLFLSHHHNEALDHLLYGIQERKGFIAIFGGIGTGKTTLCRALLNHLDRNTKTALIFNTSISDIELLLTINQEFGIHDTDDSTSKKGYLDRLNRFLLDNHRRNGNAVLILDEAQNLSAESLEQLRMISNLETEKEKLIQIILVGQPELMGILESPSLTQLNERITVRYLLKPLDRSEIGGYIEHRLLVAGSRGNIRLKKGAVGAVFAHSEGNPRRINAICDRALLIAFCRDEFTIGKETIRCAVDDIRGRFNVPTNIWLPWSQKRVAQVFALVLMAFIIANIAGWDMKHTVLPFFSAAEKITAVQAKAFHRDPDYSGSSATIMEIKPFVRKTIEYPIVAEAKGTHGAGQEYPGKNVHVTAVSELSLDDRTSLSILLKLFDAAKAELDLSNGEIYPGLFAFKGDPELYRTFARPFRVRIKPEMGSSAGYFVVKEVTPDGAIGLDANGSERLIHDADLLKHWAGEMSWVYPYENVSGKLTKGMNGLPVLKVQKMLQQLGYDVQTRGVFDKPTFEEVMRFQLNQGLTADGVVDTGTKALLYQMTG
jgi:general secretion pathway protein A